MTTHPLGLALVAPLVALAGATWLRLFLEHRGYAAQKWAAAGRTPDQIRRMIRVNELLGGYLVAPADKKVRRDLVEAIIEAERRAAAPTELSA